MENPLFLEQLFGIYFVIVGIIFAARRDAIRDIINALKANRPLVILLGLLEVIAGLAIVITHSEFTNDYRAIVTVVGYWLVVEGILYIILPKKTLKKFLSYFNKGPWYTAGSVLAIILGAYLIVKGFGWWM